MRKLIFSLLLLIPATIIFAQGFNISGQVTSNNNGAPVPNHLVYITPLDSTQSIVQPVTVTTDANGYYVATFAIPNGLTMPFLVYTYGNCNPSNNYYYQYVTATSGVYSVQVNFVICLNNQSNPCTVDFTWNVNPQTSCGAGEQAYLFSGYSTSNSPIVSWEWTLNNGQPVYNQNPVFCLQTTGNNNVCLTILTTDSCISTECHNVVIDTFFTGCQAYFYYDFDNPSNPYEVEFIDQSNGNVTNWLWSFGDGTSSSIHHPHHTYQQAGSYIVTLTITTADGCTSTFTDIIYVQGQNVNSCQAAFYSYLDSTVYCFLGSAYTFIDYSSSNSPILTWEWNMGDGNIVLYDQNPTYCYANEGTYQVCLTIFSDSCTDSYCQYITVGDSITPNCQAYFSYYNTPASGQFYDYSYGGAISWNWDFGDGTTSQVQYPIHTYSTDGYYNVCLSIFTSAGCSSTYCDSIYYTSNGQQNCVADFSYYMVNDSTGGQNCTTCVQFLNQSIVSTNALQSFWSFGDGTSSYDFAPTHTYAAPGLYTVCLIISTPDNCVDSICESVYVGNAPTYSIEGYVFAGSQNVLNCIVLLMGNNGSLFSSTINPSSLEYEFNNIPAGTYIVYAVPSYIDFPNYVPTYYPNALYWNTATEINLNANVMDADIYLVGYSSTNTGTCFIGGNVSWGFLLKSSSYTNRLDNSVQDITILLLDLSDNLLDFTTTDVQGNFSFSDLPYGTYKLYTEMAGYTTYPAIITLDESNPSVTGISIIINGTSIIIAGVDDISNNLPTVSLFPNPVKDVLTLNINVTTAQSVSYSVQNLVGQEIVNSNLGIINGSFVEKVNVSALPEGIYYIRFQAGNNNPVVMKFVK